MKKLDCVDKFISRLFGNLGGCIARHPLPFLLIPLAILAVLSVGLSQLEIEDNVEHLFTPANSPGRTDLKATQAFYMTGNEGVEFIPNRELDLFLGRGRLILSRLDGGNIIDPEHPEYMEDVYKLDKLIRSTPLSGNGSTFEEELCMRWSSRCVPNPIIIFHETHRTEYGAGLFNLSYPNVAVEFPINMNAMNIPGQPAGGNPMVLPDRPVENIPQNKEYLHLLQQQNGGTLGTTTNPNIPPRFGPDKIPDGYDPQNFPKGVNPQNIPEGFNPQNIPAGFDPQNIPQGFDPQSFPQGFDPQNLPEGFDPQAIPNGFNPANIPNGFNPQDIPAGLDPNIAVLLAGGTITETIFIGPNLGGVEFHEGTDDIVKSATHILLFYTTTSNPEIMPLAHQWENEVFMKVTEDYKNKTNLLKIDRVVSTSLATEVNEVTHKVIPRFATTFSMMVLFAVFSCIMRDWVLSKPWLGFLGVISAAMSIISSIGLLSFMGMKYNEVVSLMPFLVMGVGVDNMFIMIAAWRQHPIHETVEKRMTDTFAEAAVSITITNITDILAFIIGAVSVLPGVRMFCIYAGIAMVFVYFYQITFFGACMALIGKREFQNRHCMWGFKVQSREEEKAQYNKFYKIFCSGGRSLKKRSCNKKIDLEHRVMKFFRQYYGPFLMKPWVKIIVIIFYFVYVAGALIGCTKIQEGIRFKNLAMDNSPAWNYYDLEDTYFRRYGPQVSVIFTDEIPYWEETTQIEIEQMTQIFEDGEYTWGSDLTISWMRKYTSFLQTTHGTSDLDKNTFISVLKEQFLEDPRNSEFKLDIIFRNDSIDTYGETHWSIISSRFLVTSKNVDTALRERSMMLEFRNKAADLHFNLLTFHPSFKVFDQYVGVINNTLQTLGIAMLCMFIIACVMIPHPICAIWVTLCVISIDCAVIGYMSMWGVTLDAISMVNIILCIGFSVDFSAHITYAFVIAPEKDPNKRAISALHSLGMPILQGALSSIIAISVLSTAPVYIFRTFFKTLFLVMVFGAAHGLILLPVCLSFLGKCMPQEPTKEEKKERHLTDTEAQLDEWDPKAMPLIYEYSSAELEQIILQNFLHARETDV